MDKEYIQLLPIKLNFFDGSEKTEQATPKKRRKAREQGQVAKSDEINKAASLIIGFFCFGLFIPGVFLGLQGVFSVVFNAMRYYDMPLSILYMNQMVAHMFSQVVIIAAPIMVAVFVLNFVLMVLQVKWRPTIKPIMPKLSKISPIAGFKRLFSFRAILDLFKSLIKFIVIILVVYMELYGELENFSSLMYMPLAGAFIFLGSLAIRLAITIGIWFILIAAIDYAYQRYKHNKDLKMSKHEVKEEWKQMDGNPQIKRKIKQKMQEASMRRMMQSMPSADVVITNPEHFAVAIKYDTETAFAPIVVAKGTDHLAKRIKDKAKENNITIVENKPLARALFAAVEVGREIPQELYKAVAEILAYVYKLKNKV